MKLLVYSVYMSLITLFAHMCAIGFAILAISDKSKNRKNLYIGMAIMFFGLTFII